MGKTKDEAKGNADGSGKRSKRLQKVTKAKNHDNVGITSRMIIEALNQMDGERKEEEKAGHSLAKIRSYIKKHHGITMTKNHQEALKMVMRHEFENDRIEMTNHGGKLNFTMRFQATIDDDDIADDDEPASNATDSDSEEEDEE